MKEKIMRGIFFLSLLAFTFFLGRDYQMKKIKATLGLEKIMFENYDIYLFHFPAGFAFKVNDTLYGINSNGKIGELTLENESKKK